MSFAHFVWGPKPWMAAATKAHERGFEKRNAVQADAPFANEYFRPAPKSPVYFDRRRLHGISPLRPRRRRDPPPRPTAAE